MEEVAKNTSLLPRPRGKLSTAQPQLLSQVTKFEEVILFGSSAILHLVEYGLLDES